MKTKTYDLNLYVINGQLKVLAHELELSSGDSIQTGSNFHETVVIDLYRGNRQQWEKYLDMFGERELYSELDSWCFAPLEDNATPVYEFTPKELQAMPIELALAIEQLPEYELV